MPRPIKTAKAFRKCWQELLKRLHKMKLDEQVLTHIAVLSVYWPQLLKNNSMDFLRNLMPHYLQARSFYLKATKETAPK